jgi:hypothetical protein
VAGAAAALTLALSSGGGRKSATKHSNRVSVTIKAPPTTPAWLLSLASRKAHEVTKSAPTTGLIEKRRLTYEVGFTGTSRGSPAIPAPEEGHCPSRFSTSLSSESTRLAGAS